MVSVGARKRVDLVFLGLLHPRSRQLTTRAVYGPDKAKIDGLRCVATEGNRERDWRRRQTDWLPKERG